MKHLGGTTRMFGLLIPVLAAGSWPTAALAVDTAVTTQGNQLIVYIVILLLAGAVAAGLFFASPYRRMLLGKAAGEDRPAPAREAEVAPHPDPGRPPAGWSTGEPLVDHNRDPNPR